eukprot:350383-Chlamydomonas_euryale.AAC.7
MRAGAQAGAPPHIAPHMCGTSSQAPPGYSAALRPAVQKACLRPPAHRRRRRLHPATGALAAVSTEEAQSWLRSAQENQGASTGGRLGGMPRAKPPGARDGKVMQPSRSVGRGPNAHICRTLRPCLPVLRVTSASAKALHSST